MKRFIFIIACLLNSLIIFSQDKFTKSCKPCESFKQLSLPEVSIQKAEGHLKLERTCTICQCNYSAL